MEQFRCRRRWLDNAPRSADYRAAHNDARLLNGVIDGSDHLAIPALSALAVFLRSYLASDRAHPYVSSVAQLLDNHGKATSVIKDLPSEIRPGGHQVDQ